jgi:hypothetical protein
MNLCTIVKVSNHKDLRVVLRNEILNSISTLTCKKEIKVLVLKLKQVK